jgi:hypothetical protein
MPEATSAVTPARWEAGLTWSAFLGRTVINLDKFNENFRNAPLTDDDVAFLKKCSQRPNGPRKILAIVEAWCGDVYRELPVMARWAEAAGIPLRIVLRDENPDIMDEFLLGEQKARAIPVFVFYTGDMRYIGHWTERSAGANAARIPIMEATLKEMGLPPGTKLSAMDAKVRADFLNKYRAQIGPLAKDWQKDGIAEMRALLEKNVR